MAITARSEGHFVLYHWEKFCEELAVDPPALWEEQRGRITAYFEDTDSK